MKFIPVILAGGKGERFWPLSRQSTPKQFLSLDGTQKSLIQATSDRLTPLSDQGIWVVTKSSLVPLVQDHLSHLPSDQIIAEPVGRDTAPAIAYTTLEIAKRYGSQTIIGFFPADHWIKDLEQYHHSIKIASQLAHQQNTIITLGIKPQYPATGYGYIEQGKAIATLNNLTAYQVNRFTEKPNLETAQQFLASDRHTWNSGIFIFQAEIMLQELKTHAPQIINPLEEQGISAYHHLTPNSIDYAVMEKTQKAAVIPVEFGWDDLGDWRAIERLLETESDNIELSQHLHLDSKGNILYNSDSQELIVTLGIEDLVIVRNDKVTLIMKKDRTQEIKKILTQIAQQSKFQDLL